MGKIKGLCSRAGNDLQKGAFLAAVRVSNVAPPDGDRLSMIFPYFLENRGQPMGFVNGPIFVSQSRLRIAHI